MNRDKVGLPANRENFIPSESDWLNNKVSGAAMSSASSFKNPAVTSYGPSFRFEFLSEFLSDLSSDFFSRFLVRFPKDNTQRIISYPDLTLFPFPWPWEIWVRDYQKN